MCRLLLVKSNRAFPSEAYLKKFASVCKNSKEYQGHGWGCSFYENNWETYTNIKPVWEDAFDFIPPVRFLLAHARSAFQNEGIVVENNMPFEKDGITFIFNGELHGVRIKESGRTGAEKIFNYILRFYKSSLAGALEKAAGIIKKRTLYIRAMNIIISDGRQSAVYSHFNEDAGYFSLRRKQEQGRLIVCSEQWGGKEEWEMIKNNELMEITE